MMKQMMSYRAAGHAALLAAAMSLPSHSIAAGAHDHSMPTASGHAPIGVMGDHMHKKGEWMFSYRYMFMDMQGNRDGSSSISDAEIISLPHTLSAAPPTLRVVPRDMTMEMHMLGTMYAPSDTVTLMAMTNYIIKEMDHTTYPMAPGAAPQSFTTKVDGIGDTSLSALVRLSKKLHGLVGLSLPTGSIDEEDQVITPMMAGTEATLRLPYPMQLGSGTYDLTLGLTLLENFGSWDVGGQWKSIIRTGENDEDYTLGDQLHLSSWLSYSISDAISVSSRLAYMHRDNIDGRDTEVNAPVQTAYPNRQAMDRIDLSLGVNWLLPDNKNRLAFEIGAPVYQHLDGPQLETDMQFTLGWQYAP